MKRIMVLCISILLILITPVYAYSSTNSIIDYPNEYVEVFNQMTQEDWSYLAKCVMCEAGQSNLECAEATTCVILNRVLNQFAFKGDTTVKEVVLHKGQFTTRPLFARARPNELTYTAIANVQNHGARVIRNLLAEQGWDIPSTAYVFFSVGKPKYGANYLYAGIPGVKGQYHCLATEKDNVAVWGCATQSTATYSNAEY